MKRIGGESMLPRGLNTKMRYIDTIAVDPGIEEPNLADYGFTY